MCLSGVREVWVCEGGIGGGVWVCESGGWEMEGG